MQSVGQRYSEGDTAWMPRGKRASLRNHSLNRRIRGFGKRPAVFLTNFASCRGRHHFTSGFAETMAPHDNGKTIERWRRKASGLKATVHGSGVTERNLGSRTEVRWTLPG